MEYKTAGKQSISAQLSTQKRFNNLDLGDGLYVVVSNMPPTPGQFQLVSTANFELDHIRTDLSTKQTELTQATADIMNLKVTRRVKQCRDICIHRDLVYILCVK